MWQLKRKTERNMCVLFLPYVVLATHLDRVGTVRENITCDILLIIRNPGNRGIMSGLLIVKRLFLPGVRGKDYSFSGGILYLALQSNL